MRLWSLHPRYLDPQGLVALWREGLLARAVLRGETRGYTRHPQLARFQAHPQPRLAINAYLAAVATEAERRGYAFDRGRIGPVREVPAIAVTTGQLALEWRHLQGKLAVRNPALLARWSGVASPRCHPLFRRRRGPVESWERAVPPAPAPPGPPPGHGREAAAVQVRASTVARGHGGGRMTGGMVTIRDARASDAGEVSRLILGLTGFFLPDPDAANARTFLDSVTPRAVAERIASPGFDCLVAEAPEGLCGFAALRDGSHLYHLFVATGRHRQGIARRLWEQLRARTGAGAFTVNATPFAVPAYERLGFSAGGAPQANDGLAYVPMVHVRGG